MEKLKLYNLSMPQKAILLTEQYYSGTSVNNIGGGIVVHEPLNFELFKKAIHRFVEYHDSFRIRLKKTSDGVKQYFEDFAEFDIEIVDLKDEAEVAKLDEQMLYRPINLFEEPLFEFKIFRFPNNHGGFVIKMHHLISDGWTSGLACRKIMHEYSNLLKNIDETCFSKLSYTNYLQSEQQYFSTTKFEKDQSYWRETFKNLPNIISIPSTTDTSTDFSCEGNRSYFVIPKEDVEQISRFCSNHSVSIFNFFMSILGTYLYKINNIDNFVIGTPILNRSNVKEKDTAGMFINVAPLRISFENKVTFHDLVSSISKDSMALLRHQKYPYQQILEDLRKQDSSIPNLYNIVLSYQITRSNNECEIPYDTRWSFSGCCTDDIDVHLYDMDEQGILNVAYDYKTSKYSYIDIENIHRRLMHMIKQVLKKEEIEIKDIEIVTPEEKHKILVEFNNTSADYPKDKTVVDLFEEQVEKTPDHVAVVFGEEKLTYRELNEKANQLANYLINLKIKDNDKIAILLPRCSELILAMLAIKKSNCAYLLIEKSLPLERIQYMLQNANVSYVITNKDLASDELPSLILENIVWDELNHDNLGLNYLPENPLSVVYTSGSTGTPKGILVKNNSIVNLVLGYCHSMQAHTLSNFLSICSVSFDMFAAEIWIPLLLGKKLILANEEESMNPIVMLDLIKKYKIEFMLITPSRMNLLLLDENASQSLRSLKAIQLGGEVLNSQFYEKLITYTKSKIYNGYGPSETTSCATCKLVISGKEITIGTPLPNIQVYICNKVNNLCPPNTIGELCIAGDGISYGYINQPELTNMNFIDNPFGNGLLYKTGDLAKFLPSGEIEFIGRNDNQVKIRGLRIELEEINKVIEQFSDIENCITLIKKVNNIEAICCYFTGKKVSVEKLKNHASNQLPHYMVPSHFVKLKKFPLTMNGKIDKNELPEIQVETIYVAPETEMEVKIAHLWKSLFSLDKISTTSNFFELGGDSLNAIQLVTQIEYNFNIKINIKDVFSYPTIRDLANYLKSANLKEASQNKILKTETEEFYPASSAQKRIYYTVNQEGKNSTAYNISGSLILDQIPDIEKLNLCFKKIIEKNSSFRTYFEIKNNQVVQKILEKAEFNIEMEKSEHSNIEKIMKDFIRPFDLSIAPLLRVKLVKLKNGNGLLLMDMHHIIGDGATFKLLINQLSDLYNENNPKYSKIDYKDFSIWELENMHNNKYQEAENYWLSQFKDDIPVLELPTNYIRPATQSFEGSDIVTIVNEDLMNQINQICKENKITPFMLFLSVYYILLSFYARTEDITVGAPISGRYNEQMLNIMGMFVNTLALRQKIDYTLTFRELVNNVKQQVLISFEYQNYPLDELIKKLHIKRNISRNALFDVLFTYQNDSYPKVKLGEINTKYYIPKVETSKVDLSLEVIPEENQMKLRFEYCTKLFTEEFIQNLSEHFMNILKNIIENFDEKISDIDILCKSEKNKILKQFNNTYTDYPKNKTVVELFEEQVNKNKNRTALVFEETKITYNDLNKKSNQIANYLLEKYQLEPQNVIAIFLDKSIESILAILSIIKMGCIFVPIDTEYPIERINYILKDSKAKLILTKEEYSNLLETKVPKVYIDLNNALYQENSPENPICAISSNDLIYMMYTSGSTGKPKGVMITHQNVVRLVKNTNYIEFSENERILQTGSIVFDASTFEIWGALLNGGTLYLMEKQNMLEQSYFENYLKNNKITSIFLTTALFNQYCEASPTIFEKLKTVLTGGEAVSVKHMQLALRNFPKLNIVHVYGPTENTTFSTYHVVKEIQHNTIPIGKAIANSTAYVVSDKTGNLQPIGVPGELWVGGDGVGKGYLNRDDLTMKNFIDNPFGEGKIYKTGDLVKLLPDGNIEFIGRIDNQVKIRGFRIELNEIDSLIREYPYISKAHTIVSSINSKKYIITYFTADKNLTVNDINLYLQEKLPFYMVPQFLIQLDEFPLTINGKIDKSKLPEPELTTLNEYVPPENEVQEQLCSIWRNLFKMKKVSILDNFFELGGDSLTAIKFQTEALKLDININYSDIFENPTIKSLSEKKQNKQLYKVDKNYNYSKINKILSINTLENIEEKVEEIECKNLLLCGATGFLGAHILDAYLSNTNGNIYCLVRKKENTDSITRLKNLLNFYFENKYDDYFGNRINVVYGDITLDNLGLSEKEYKKLGNSIDIMINSAAFVKHFGNFKTFQSINVIGTRNIVKFCKTFNKKLYHISTMSVAGMSVQDEKIKGDEERILFNETNFYVGQNLDNAYVYTKFESEKEILKEIPNGLQACILRMGNISNRVSDGKFQINVSENAFINRIKSLLNVKVIQSRFLNHAVEFTPVDASAEAIIKIIKNNPKFTVLHMFNTKVINIPDLFAILKSLGYVINPVEDKVFSNTIKEFLKQDELKSKISGLIPDLNTDKTLALLSRTLQNGYFTTQYLKSIGYEWTEINKDYITKYMEYFKRIGYIE